ncbi:MAG: hypothetical protein AAFR66_11350 [Bacteroidota bacterium]
MMKRLFITIGLLGFMSFTYSQYEKIHLDNGKVFLQMELHNSAISEFRFKDGKLNPLSWVLPKERMPLTHRENPSFRGHFMALGNWAVPGEGEEEAGIVVYGGVNTYHWDILQAATETQEGVYLKTACTTGLEGLRIERETLLHREKSLVEIQETITNLLPIGRAYQFLQHPTIGPPFLDEHLVVNSNASKGFFNRGPFAADRIKIPEEDVYDWPMAILPEGEHNLEKTLGYGDGFLSTHIFPDSATQGWVTAHNLKQNLLIGYVFSTKDYPWIHFWQRSTDGVLEARAFEFANVGISEPIRDLITSESHFHGRSSIEFLDAGESQHKFYFMFLWKPPQDLQRIKDVSVIGKEVRISFETSQGEESVTL